MSKPHDPRWAKAKQLCRLNMEDIRMAKELGLSPKALLKNQPSPTQRWKAPVKLWIRALHEKRFGGRVQPPIESRPLPKPRPREATAPDESIPF